MARVTASYSSVVGTWTNAEAEVLLPDRQDQSGPYPVLYLLHDMADNHTIWNRMTRLEWYARSLPLVIVLPDGERGFHTDTTPGHAYEQLFIQDLMGFVEQFFPVRTDRAGRAVGGFGMGGYGALKFALKHPGLFGSVTAHAGMCDLGHHLAPDADDSWKAQFARVFGSNFKGGDDDIFALSRRYEGADWPAIQIDCGLDDPYLEENRRFRDHLEHFGVAHRYAEYPGGHDWDYCDARLVDVLDFHWRTIGTKGEAEGHAI
jgi:putative tributyrin esterase